MSLESENKIHHLSNVGLVKLKVEGGCMNHGIERLHDTTSSWSDGWPRGTKKYYTSSELHNLLLSLHESFPNTPHHFPSQPNNIASLYHRPIS